MQYITIPFDTAKYLMKYIYTPIPLTFVVSFNTAYPDGSFGINNGSCQHAKHPNKTCIKLSQNFQWYSIHTNWHYDKQL